MIIKEKDDIKITINQIKNNDKIEVGGMSVSEKFISNLAFRLAFGRLDRNMCVNFLIIDEGFDNCSDENLPKFKNMFELIKKQYKWCIVISHLEKIKNFYDDTYSIEKNENGYSKIII